MISGNVLLFKDIKISLGQGGLAATFDLAAFLVSMIASVKKSVNHLRILPSMRVTGKPKHVLVAIFVRDLPSI